MQPIVRAAANRLGNRIMHPNLGERMLDHLVVTEDASILASHCISDSAAVELRAGNFDLFVERREADLSAMLTRFLASRTRWDESDRPPISALIVPEVTETVLSRGREIWHSPGGEGEYGAVVSPVKRRATTTCQRGPWR